MRKHTDATAARAAEAASSSIVAEVRKALADLDKAHEIEGQLLPAAENACAAAASNTARKYAALDGVMAKIPSPPQSVGDLAALALVAQWIGVGHGPLGVEPCLEDRVCARLVDGALSLAGLDAAPSGAPVLAALARAALEGRRRP